MFVADATRTAPIMAPRTAPAMSTPIGPGPTFRTSLEITGTMCWYGNISRFIKAVTVIVAIKAGWPHT